MNTSMEKIVTGIKVLNQKLGVISTASLVGKPEAAVVYFSCDEQLNVYFTTRATSRKYKNILENPQVAFVIYAENPPETIQLEGIATTVTDPYEQTTLFSEVVALANKNNSVPPIDQLQETEIMFIKISVTWARMADFEITRNGEVFTESTM